jgi:hypothetical protein
VGIPVLGFLWTRLVSCGRRFSLFICGGQGPTLVQIQRMKAVVIKNIFSDSFLSFGPKFWSLESIFWKRLIDGWIPVPNLVSKDSVLTVDRCSMKSSKKGNKLFPVVGRTDSTFHHDSYLS